MHIAELSESISGRYSIVLCPVVCERHSSSHTQRASLMFTLQTRGCLSLTHIVFTFKAQREHQQSVTGPRRRVGAFWMTLEPISEPLTSRWRFWMTREPISEPLTSRWRLLLSIPARISWTHSRSLAWLTRCHRNVCSAHRNLLILPALAKLNKGLVFQKLPLAIHSSIHFTWIFPEFLSSSYFFSICTFVISSFHLTSEFIVQDIFFF